MVSMKNSDLKSIKLLLVVIAMPIVFYILKVLSFIFIPLLFSMLIALFFMPLMRKMNKLKVHKVFSLMLVVLIIGVFVMIINQIIQYSGKELMSPETDIINKIILKINETVFSLESSFNIELVEGEDKVAGLLKQLNLKAFFKSTGSIISMSISATFFTILLLVESLNFQRILNQTLIKGKSKSIKLFIKIEQAILTFVKVKFLMSLFTGVGFSLACYFFDVDFPIFWGFVTFLLNFIQMIGSFIAIIILALFAFVGIEDPSTLFFFILSISGVQVIFGSITEPILMGKSFSINVVTILIMLMFWGFIWGIPGMILSVPLTVFIKIMLEQFNKTKILAALMS